MAIHKNAALLFTVALIVASGCSSAGQSNNAADPPDQSAPARSAQLLDPAAFAAYIEENPDTPLINVHIPYEQHITGTDAFVPFDTILEWNELPADRSAPLALYCRSGNMSGTATQALTDAGYTNIIDLDGGMKAWSDADYQLVNDDPDAPLGRFEALPQAPDAGTTPCIRGESDCIAPVCLVVSWHDVVSHQTPC